MGLVLPCALRTDCGRHRDLARKTLAVVAVTMEDLYPGDDWNFVYGQAYALEAVGVCACDPLV